MFSILGKVVRLIGRKFAWKINKEDEIYLQNYYDRLANIDGNLEFARKMTETMKEEILIRKELKFFKRIKG